METGGGLGQPAPAGTELTHGGFSRLHPPLLQVRGPLGCQPCQHPKTAERSTMLLKLLPSPYLAPHRLASGKGSERPTGLHCGRSCTHWWVSFPGLGRPSPAPRSSAHMYGRQTPPGKGGRGVRAQPSRRVTSSGVCPLGRFSAEPPRLTRDGSCTEVFLRLLLLCCVLAMCSY